MEKSRWKARKKQPEAKRKTRRLIRHWLMGGLLSLAVVFSLAISLGEQVGGGFLPSWRQIYRFFGVSDTVETDLPLHVRIFEVGAADCILITCGERTLLIDAGTVDKGNDIACKLERLGINRLDLVVATHPHNDHIGGMEEILRRFPVGQMLMPEVPEDLTPTTPSYMAMLTALREQKIPVKKAEAGQVYEYGGLRVQVLYAGLEAGASANLNNSSVVLRVTFGGVTFLLMGDSEKSTEQKLLAQGELLRADVLKLGHHGSKTSTSQAFLAAVGPKLGAISCGENTPPSDTVLTRLRQMGVRYCRTDLDGDITYASDGRSIEVYIQNERVE